MILIEANRLHSETAKALALRPHRFADRPRFTLDEMNRSYSGINNVSFREPRHTSVSFNAKFIILLCLQLNTTLFDRSATLWSLLSGLYPSQDVLQFLYYQFATLTDCYH